MKKEIRPDDSETEVFRAWCTWATCPSDGETKRITVVDGQPATAIIYDAFGRETLRATVAWTADSASEANISVVDTEYDAFGHVKKSSRPYFDGATPVWHAFEYDLLGRQTKETAPGSRVTDTEYSGLETEVTDAEDQATAYTRNVRGELIEVEDEDGNAIAYAYDPFGNLLETEDSEGNKIANTFNVRGFRESIDDPDSGETAFEYNALGELIEQTDAKGQEITFEYDLIGRLTERDDIDGTGGVTAWTYDTATDGEGLIHTVDGAEGDDHTYTYDSNSRLTTHRTAIDGTNYDVQYAYDADGRLDTLQYPGSSQYSSGLEIRYNYTAEGQLRDVENTDGDELFWEIDGAGADGQLTGETFGNGVSTARAYDANTGWVTDIESGYSTGTDRQNEGYEWDDVGNLTKRHDDLQSLSEAFAYDDLNRLTQSTVTGETAKTYAYDEIGNLENKSDVSSTDYTYGTQATGCAETPGPHAVSVADGQAFCYDKNGNMTDGYNFRSDTARTYEWTTYNKPSEIEEGSTTIEFRYGADRGRFKQDNSASGVVTRYVGNGLFEERTEGSNTTEVHYIQALGRTVAIYTSISSTGESTRYLHGDHLGSIVLVTDEDGDVEGDRYSFDPFGRRRNGDDWTDTLTNLANPDTTMGYTGHESLDDVDIVHMNGRIYDPFLGRVLSADPFVPAPHDMQSFNRYSYVRNNPLARVDPSGYLDIDDYMDDYEWWCWVNWCDTWVEPYDPGGGGGGSTPAPPRAGQARPIAGRSLTGHGWVAARGVADTAADVLIPGYGLARCNWEDNCTVWDWGLGALDIGVTVVVVVGTAGVGYGAVVAAKGAVRGGVRAVQRRATTAARRMSCSFVAGTLVVTAEGFKPIEAIAAGDWVLARDPETGKLEPKRVTFAYSSIHEDVLILTVRQGDGDEELIVTTSEHPFHVQDRAWVPAGELTLDDILVTLSGETLSLRAIEFLAGARTAYNFEVADFHTYGVGDSQVWVHNACDYDPSKFKGRDALRRHNKQARDAAQKIGLNKDQQRKLHDQISGHGYSYHEILEIARDIKAGRI